MQQREASGNSRAGNARPMEPLPGTARIDPPEIALLDVTVRGGAIVAAFAEGRISRSEAMAQLRAVHLGGFGEHIRA